MWFTDDSPWLSLIKPRVLMNVVTWLSHMDSWNCTDCFFGPVVGVNPSYVVLPNVFDIVMDVPVVLTRETVVMRIDSFCDPPFALDISNTGKIFLSVVFSNSTFHVVWLLWLTAILENALCHFRESRKISVLSDFTVKVTTEIISASSTTQDAGQ